MNAQSMGVTEDNFKNPEFTRLVVKKLLLPDTIFRLNYIPDRVSGIFLWYLFNSEIYSKKIRALANGAAGSMPNIAKSKLLNLKMPLPELSLQIKFAQIVCKVEVLKKQFQESLQELENLYGSLSQKAFKGELDLSRIDISQLEEGVKKTELEPIGEDKWIGKTKVQDNKVNLDEIIKNDFESKLFSINDLDASISNRELYIENSQVKSFLKKAMQENKIEQVYSGDTKQVMFKLKK